MESIYNARSRARVSVFVYPFPWTHHVQRDEYWLTNITASSCAWRVLWRSPFNYDACYKESVVLFSFHSESPFRYAHVCTRISRTHGGTVFFFFFFFLREISTHRSLCVFFKSWKICELASYRLDFLHCFPHRSQIARFSGRNQVGIAVI